MHSFWAPLQIHGFSRVRLRLLIIDSIECRRRRFAPLVAAPFWRMRVHACVMRVSYWLTLHWRNNSGDVGTAVPMNLRWSPASSLPSLSWSSSSPCFICLCVRASMRAFVFYTTLVRIIARTRPSSITITWTTAENGRRRLRHDHLAIARCNLSRACIYGPTTTVRAHNLSMRVRACVLACAWNLAPCVPNSVRSGKRQIKN